MFVSKMVKLGQESNENHYFFSNHKLKLARLATLSKIEVGIEAGGSFSYVCDILLEIYTLIWTPIQVCGIV